MIYFASPSVVFITGCGRSGTTTLGNILGRHPDVAYLNDRFDLWTRVFPEADIWGRGPAAQAATARIEMVAADARPEIAARFVELLRRERGRKALLAEKLPINSFRLGFLFELFPDACVIDIVRNGIDVARSIAAEAVAGRWYGARGRKWDLLVEYARGHGYGPLIDICSMPFLRGLLEWRMSVEAVERYLADHEVRVLRLRYEELLSDPAGTASAMTDFLGLPQSARVERFAGAQIARFRRVDRSGELPVQADVIAGETLRRLGYWPVEAAPPLRQATNPS
jgi:hypothetical protein